jgi:hypothetical protein
MKRGFEAADCITQMHLNFLHQDSLTFLPPRMLRHIISYKKTYKLLLKEENPSGFPPLIPVFPPKLITLDLVDITQFALLDNDMYFTIVANFGQHPVNTLDLFEGKPQKLQVVGKFRLFYRFVFCHVFLPIWAADDL